ncbi:hypothetical protein VHEMI06618 [[Torrubiella] hemipterigena]|uniref:F-box domain-containing protein n=1 Tax=[Torrubiella] hemipterigena TaxID=1531966 RepID=A0A0A1TJJ1_9HYPO|nr:hypothetical protein VHEMI06618 [[Torrubiella] hemipterigena]
MISSLPNELLALIFNFINEEDLLAALLTCRLWHHLGLPRFAQVHCSLMTLDLEGPSLERAKQIIENGVYRAAVTIIEFRPQRFFGYRGQWLRDDAGTLVSSRHWDTLQKVLNADYPNLSKIVVLADEDHFFEEYSGSPMVATLPEVIGFAFDLIATARHPVQCCDMQLVPRLPMFCFQTVNIPVAISEQFWSRWANLRCLNLDTYTDASGQDAALLGDLIINAHQLNKLRLGNCIQDASGNFARLLDRLVAAPQLPQLTHLSIASAAFQSPDELLGLLRRFKHSLEHIFLEFVTMVVHWKEAIAQMQQELTALQSFAISLSRETANLDQGLRYKQMLLFCPLLYTIPQENLSCFHFREYTGKRMWRRSLSSVQYKGPDARWALGLIKDAVYTLNSFPQDLRIYDPDEFDRLSLEIDYSEFEF